MATSTGESVNMNTNSANIYGESSVKLPRIVAPPHRPSIALTGAEAIIHRQRRKSIFEEAVRVEFYVNENTLKEKLHLYFIKNQQSSLRIRTLKLTLKSFACLLYVIRVIMDRGPAYAGCHGCPITVNQTILDMSRIPSPSYANPYHDVNWKAIIWIDRSFYIWLLQTITAVTCLIEALLLEYLTYKGNIIKTLLNFHLILEIGTNTAFLPTILLPKLRNIFVPGFLNCWLAKRTLENMFNDLNRVMQRSQSALSHRLMILSATLLCLIFTSVCGFQHFQRAGGRNVNLFESLYFVVVTFATVGYGDYRPENMPSQLFMVIMICVAFILLPTQFEQLACTWVERQKLGRNYSIHRSQTEKHVVVCATTLRADTVMDFLNEFYAHPLLQDFYVVLLSPCELDTTMKMILQVPMWAQRVIYIHGSALKDTDLTRARMNEAEACFILAARKYNDRSAADEHTILRSWAIRDFAPNVPQYVQIFRPENKIHVAFAEHVVCEDEFKYALLANNCLCPGASTLVTLLLHTSRGQYASSCNAQQINHKILPVDHVVHQKHITEGQTSDEDWHRLYGKCSGNEIYHIRLSESRFFGEYEGKSFTYASFHSHRKYGVALIGVQTDMRGTWPIMLNPGPSYILKSSDICFYMNITKEENSAFLPATLTDSSKNRGKISSGLNVILRMNKSRGSPKDKNGGFGVIGSAEKSSSDEYNTHTGCDNRSARGSRSSVGGSDYGDYATEDNGEDGDDTDDNSKKGDKKHRKLKKAVIKMAGRASRKMRKQSTHLDIPVIEYGSASRDSSPSGDAGSARGRRPSIAPVPVMLKEQTEDSDEPEDKDQDQFLDVPPGSVEPSEIVKGFPPVSPYVGVSPTLCYLLKEKKPTCCLRLSTPCDHCEYKNARDYNWTNPCIILSADFASNGIYNFIVPLRAHFHSPLSLRPIVLLLESQPLSAFLDAISWFPLVYWMQGSINKLDDLLHAGINLAESVVVVNKESTNSAEEDYLGDCNTVVAVQTMFKMFPSVRIITELSQSSNMRFMQFRAHDIYALSLSRVEKYERETGSHISYMFRLPFAAGSVFSASMLDTLLYQAFVKDYMITVIRLLLGIDQAPGSGFLSSIKITKDDLWIRTYGRLYQKLCSTTCEIPIGIYRTQLSKTTPDPQALNFEFVLPISERAHYQQLSAEIERQEICNLVRNRMQDIGLPIEDYDDVSEKRSSLSYVIINPSCDLPLEEGDFIYIIRPSPIKSKKTFLTRGNSTRMKASLRRNYKKKSLTDETCSQSLPLDFEQRSSKYLFGSSSLQQTTEAMKEAKSPPKSLSLDQERNPSTSPHLSPSQYVF
ncbi:potassium channel subfamily T member 2-like isoform X2 [Brevipalpus obovatus]|uniref:potassium channel subfamily T member 2-like isoform X2 n=1 Tax=Brevipalpus obovatus TaxID=246614 RepID=UPI003D9E9943